MLFTYANLRTILDSRGISFRQLARDTGIISNITVKLNNDQPVGIEHLAKICRYLNVNIEDVVEIIHEE